MKYFTLVVFLSMIFTGASGHGGTIPPMSPNVLLIVLDDAAPLLGSYGGPVNTPNMDALAAQGQRYTLAFSNSTGCNPSRVSFATGILPVCVDTMLETDWRATLNACQPGEGSQVKTMYRTFQEAGYTTLAVGKVMHDATQQTAEFDTSVFYQPWDWIEQVANRPLNGQAEYYAAQRPIEAPVAVIDWGRLENARGPNGERFSEQDLTDWRITEDAMSRIGQLSQPWFAAVGLVSTHVPRYMPNRLVSKYMTAPLPDVLLNDYDDLPREGYGRSVNNLQSRLLISGVLSSQANWRLLDATYYAGLEYADEQVGRLLAVIPENTIVIVWSDHGYHLGQKLKIEKGTVWRESYHIPLIVAGPGVQPAVVEDVTNSTEVYSMLLSLAGLAPTDGIDRTPIPDGVIIYNGDAAIDDGTHAYIRYGYKKNWIYQVEFYDLQTDPLEWRNLTPLDEYRQRLAGYVGGFYGDNN